MTTYDSTLDRPLDLGRTSTLAPSARHEAPSTTIPHAITRALLTLVLLLGMSALFASQIAATLH